MQTSFAVLATFGLEEPLYFCAWSIMPRSLPMLLDSLLLCMMVPAAKSALQSQGKTMVAMFKRMEEITSNHAPLASSTQIIPALHNSRHVED